MTPTTVMFNGERKVFPSEQDAFVWMTEQFLCVKPTLFIAPESGRHVCRGGRGADHFALTSERMHQPKRLANGWYAELCLSNDQKVRILDRLAQYAGRLKRGTDWDWQAEHLPTRGFIDTESLLAELDRATDARSVAPE